MQSRVNDQSDDSDLPTVKEIIQEAINKIPTKRFYHPTSIYRRYINHRGMWYERQPTENMKTNERYRKAMGLPAIYSAIEYKWCLDAWPMGCFYTADGSERPWTEEEKMAFLDWSNEEDKRVEAKVAKDYNPAAKAERRPLKAMWAAAEEDAQEQEKLYKLLDMGSTKQTAIIIE